MAARFAIFPAFLFLVFGCSAVSSQSLAASDTSKTAVSSPVVAHAQRVERRASKTSFEDLEAFGRAAAGRPGDEGLSRLQHVIWVLINQDDYIAAERWNAIMRRSAERQNDARYRGVAMVNAMHIRYLRDDTVSLDEMQAFAAIQTDWLTRIAAESVVARMLIDKQRIADALRLLARVAPMIPADQASVGSVGASVWTTVSLAHMMIDDVPGYLRAIDRAETYMADSGYPNPGYDSLYNLAQSLGFLSRHDDALALVETYRRLAEKTNTPEAAAYAGTLCGYAAVAREDWPAALKCLAPFGSDLNAPRSTVVAMLPIRATAYARTGQVELAKRDVAEIHRLIENGQMTRMPAVRRSEAELMIAEGDYARGVPALRDYHLDRFARATKSAASATEQIVVGIDEQLQAATTQNRLRLQVINAQRWLVAILAIVGVGIAAMFWRQVRLSKKLSAANRRERQVHEAQAAFFANMSHEIRTPLNGVVAMADALGKADLSDEAAHMVRIIGSSSTTLERLLSDILDNAKMEAGQIAIEPLPFNLGETITDIQALWSQKAAAKGVVIEIEADPEISRWAIGDQVRLSQVLNNLVSNALKFTDEGQVNLSAQATTGDRVRFIVADTGVGFDAEQKSKIFERFQQADGTITRRFGGTGLGLSICRQLVELMGGELDCDSIPGAGSRFWFEIELPRALPADSVKPVAEPELEAMQSLKILVADDHASNRTILGLLLDDETMELRYADDGRQALDAVQETEFDVILMDMQMPVMGGLDATRAIRAFEHQTARRPATIIMLSANADPDSQKQGTDAGANGHIAKPVVLERLLEGINIAMQRNTDAQAAQARPAPALTLP